MRKLRWGVLGAARIAITKVIPAMQRCELCEVVAVASRDMVKAESAAEKLGLQKAYGSYEALLADPEIDVIYNPLPNHLHVPWTVRAAEAGKHVLCEKPLAITANEAASLIPVRERTGVTIGEAFMVQTHPQWVRAIQIVRSGQIGKLRTVAANFGYFQTNPQNVRNIHEYGGGGLLDIGCYVVKTSRMMFGEEPLRVAATVERDPKFGVDILASAVLEFPSGHCVFTCGTQMVPSQSMQFFGTTGRIEIEIPYNAIPDKTSRIRIDDGSDIAGAGVKVEEFAPCDQYTIQGDEFTKAVLERRPPPVPVEDAVSTMKVIDALFRASESGRWVMV